jgi:hypothetical protein
LQKPPVIRPRLVIIQFNAITMKHKASDYFKRINVQFCVSWPEYRKNWVPFSHPTVDYRDRRFSSKNDAEWFAAYLRIVRYKYYKDVTISKITIEGEEPL